MYFTLFELYFGKISSFYSCAFVSPTCFAFYFLQPNVLRLDRGYRTFMICSGWNVPLDLVPCFRSPSGLLEPSLPAAAKLSFIYIIEQLEDRISMHARESYLKFVAVSRSRIT